jgi:hypothetical protein
MKMNSREKNRNSIKDKQGKNNRDNRQNNVEMGHGIKQTATQKAL